MSNKTWTGTQKLSATEMQARAAMAKYEADWRQGVESGYPQWAADILAAAVKSRLDAKVAAGLRPWKLDLAEPEPGVADKAIIMTQVQQEQFILALNANVARCRGFINAATRSGMSDEDLAHWHKQEDEAIQFRFDMMRQINTLLVVQA